MSDNSFKNNMAKRGTKVLGDVKKVNEVSVEEVIEPAETTNTTKGSLVDTDSEAELEVIPLYTEEKTPFTKLGVSIKDEYKAKVNKLARVSNIKPNSAVVKVLENVFINGHFNVEFKKKSPLRVTSYNIPDNMYAEIENICNSYGLNKSEVFNRLLEEGLKYQFK